MNRLWLLFISFLILYNCENSRSKSIDPISLVPKDAEIIIKINSLESLESVLKNNTLISELSNYNQILEFKSLLEPIKLINSNNSIIAISRNDENDSLNISFIIPFSEKNSINDSLNKKQLDSIFKKNKGIHKLQLENSKYYYTLLDSLFFISNNQYITENSLLKKTTDPELKSIYNKIDEDEMVSILIDHKKNNLKPYLYQDSTFNAYKFSSYTIVDSDISQNNIILNGITLASDSTNSVINVFHNTIPQENKITTITPNDIESFKNITFHNFEIIRQNLIKHQFLDSLDNSSSVFENVIEVALLKKKKQEAIAIRSIDPISTQDNLSSQFSNRTYRSVPIYTFEDSEDILNVFSPIIKIKTARYFINLNDFFIFSNDIKFLESIISNFQNKTVLSNAENYRNLKLDLSDESSFLIYGDPSILNQILNINFNDDIKLDVDTYKSSALQYIYDTDFAHVHAVIKAHKTKRYNNAVTEELNISLDADLLTSPQLVRNHTNNQMDIVAQDVNNTLYLISNQGKVYWKKQLKGKILGKVEQIDTYKNGRLQLVFNTPKHLYVLDRNGKDVKPFPLKFNDEITQPVSVFDYDNKKNYRLMITQGKSVLMYDKRGEIVTGFKYKSAKTNISSQPKHFRIANKDYIIFKDDHKLEVLNRVGKTRLDIKESIIFSDNEIYLYKNKFTTTNALGELLEINQKGTVNHKNLNVNNKHKIATTSKTFVMLNDNKLTIKSNTINLDFGDYTPPKIFYINDKIYVTVTDLQSKKGYLFDSLAKPIANFPVFANSELELNNIDKDNDLEIITKGNNDAILVYKF